MTANLRTLTISNPAGTKSFTEGTDFFPTSYQISGNPTVGGTAVPLQIYLVGEYPKGCQTQITIQGTIKTWTIWRNLTVMYATWMQDTTNLYTQFKESYSSGTPADLTFYGQITQFQLQWTPDRPQGGTFSISITLGKATSPNPPVWIT